MYLHVLKSTCYSQTESNLFALVPKCSRNRSCAGIRTFWGRKWMGFSIVSFGWSFVIWKEMLFSPKKAGIRNQGHPFWTRHFECPGSGMKALRCVKPLRWEKLLQQKKIETLAASPVLHLNSNSEESLRNPHEEHIAKYWQLNELVPVLLGKWYKLFRVCASISNCTKHLLDLQRSIWTDHQVLPMSAPWEHKQKCIGLSE